jgi:hypothetical protein
MKKPNYPAELLELIVLAKPRTAGPDNGIINDTIAECIVEIKHPEKPCEDCGKVVADRRLNIKKNVQPVFYWKKQCSVCNLCEHPITKEYSLTQQELRSTVCKLYIEPTLHPTKGRPKGSVSKVKIDNNDK